MIYSFVDGQWKYYDSLLEATGAERLSCPLISLVGGGGKTTVMKRLQREYFERNIPSIATTTTHIQKEEVSYFLGEPSLEKLRDMLGKEKRVWMGSPCDKRKVRAFSYDFLERAFSQGCPAIIESDGAKGKPCKAPDNHEPVIVPQTDVVLCIYGLDAVGKKIKDICFRPEKVAEILGKREEDVLKPQDIVRLALSRGGGKKLVEDSMDYQIVLNKAEDEQRKAAGIEIAQELARRGIGKVHLTANLSGKNYGVVVLAAGNSRRFGSNKLLSMVDGKLLYTHTLNEINKLPDVGKVVVTQYDEIRKTAVQQGMHAVNNPHPEQGISSSVKLGLLECLKANPEVDGILFTVCDQPKLKVETFQRLLDKAADNPGKIISAGRNGKSANPVVWDKRYFEELLALKGDVGGKQIMKRYPDETMICEADAEELKDIDSIGDLDF